MKKIELCLIVAIIAATLSSCGKSSVPKQAASLYNFDLNALAAAAPKVVTVSLDNVFGGQALYFQPDSAHNQLTLPVKGAPWKDARYLVADVYHENIHSDMIWLNFYDKADMQTIRISSKIGVLPNLKTRIVLPLDYLDGQTFFMDRRVRQMKGTMPGNRLPQEQIGKVTISLEPMSKEYHGALWITNLHLAAEEPAPLPKEKPIVDQWGQWTLRDWPGKIKDEAQLTQQLTDLAGAVGNATFPNHWSAFGGWKEKQFSATGFFHVKKDGGRWWLVDPDGCAFFSVGMDCLTPSASGPVTGMEDLFEWLPDSASTFKAALSTRGKTQTVSFLTANLIRAFGGEWEQKWREITRGLLVQCRFNTIGNWSDLNLIKGAKLPYAWPLRNFPTTKLQLYRDFPDVFSQEFRVAAVKFAEQITQFKDDPYMIGYFLRNEPLWAFGENNIASEMLATVAPSATREALIDWLKQKYDGDIQRLSSAWNKELPDFEALETTAIFDAAKLSPQAEDDLWEFSRLMVDEYIRRPSEALQKLDPHHMNLGIRYAWISSELCYRGGEYFDVFSINSYTEKPNPEIVAEIARRSGKPVMIGEFHHGAIDRGLPSTGIRGVASQQERGVAYRYYVEQGAALPDLVGVHYFQLNDQPVLGRFDGENYNIGLVDICNQPYPEMMEATTQSNELIYSVAAGQQKPFERRPKLMPAIFF